MYVMMLNEAKELVTTVKATIYQGEANADTFLFLLPQQYGESLISDFVVSLQYILPDGVGNEDTLVMAPEPYKTYLKYILPIDTRFTAFSGKVTFCLSLIDLSGSVILKSSTATVTIRPSVDISAYFEPEKLSTLDRLTVNVAKLKHEKADGLVYDKDGAYMQLSADSAPIGSKIDLSDFSGDIEDIISIDGGSSVGI